MMQEGIGVVKGDGRYTDSFALVHGHCMRPILSIKGGAIRYARPYFGVKSGSR